MALPEDWTPRLRLDPEVFVAPGAVVVGDVALGRGASVWFNAVVRGDSAAISLGEDTNLQDLSVVHVDEGQPVTVGDRVTIGHRSIIHGCTIEDECLIGMGAILLSGARIGTGSLVGAGALVREGQVVPPGSVVLGLPGRVVGQVSPAQREGFRGSAAHYAALARSYLVRGFARPHPLPASPIGTASREGGIPGHLEWSRLLGVLAEGPLWATPRLDRHPEARWRQRPAPERWSALEVLCHLRDADREVYLPRLERLLAEKRPGLPDVDLTTEDRVEGYREESPRAACQAWRESRGRLLARLGPLGPAEWARVGLHSLRGPYPLGAMVRQWAEHDLSHRRQMAAALGELA